MYGGLNVCMYGGLNACMHACMHVCMYVLYCIALYSIVLYCIVMYVCMYGCMHACLYVYIYINVYIYIDKSFARISPITSRFATFLLASPGYASDRHFVGLSRGPCGSYFDRQSLAKEPVKDPGKDDKMI